MPFSDPFEDFEYRYVQRDPDIVEAKRDIHYTDPVTGLYWFAPCGEPGRCDGQSIPRFLWPALGHPLEGEAIRAAFIHDYAYKTNRRSKKEADLAFLNALRDEGDEKAYYKYLGVKLGGYFAWRRHRKNDKSRTPDL